jgi:hypothetical protein
MALSEAIAHGVPLAGTTAGAIPETAPVALESRRKHENVGAGIEGRETLGRDRAGDQDAIGGAEPWLAGAHA